MSPSISKTIYSVDSLTAEIKKLLEMSYVDVWVEGEVSQLASPPSGHLYFTLKDQNSILKCVLFKNKKYLSSSLPIEGERILIRGRVSVYTARGDVQLICSYLEAAGEGQLRRQFDALKAKLKSEGLFDEANKKQLPDRPRNIAVITSSHGAVLHDIIATLKRRYPFVRLAVYPVSVQGEQAKPEILDALSQIHKHAHDAVILARGGGSLEDLQVFNDEAVARAVYACPIPIISAIGHETDFVITDFVADQRAPTPTAAATLLTPDISETQLALQQFRKVLDQHIQYRLDSDQQRLDFSVQRLKHPRERLSIQASELRGLSYTLRISCMQILQAKQYPLENLKSALRLYSPEKRLSDQTQLLDRLKERLQRTISARLNSEQAELSQHTATLQAFNPLKTLARGYSILQNQHGEIIRSASQVSPSERIQARVHKGELLLDVKSVHHDKTA